MFRQFKDRARKVIAIAKDESRKLDQASIGTEHILLGLIGEGNGIAALVLKSLGLEIDAVRAKAAEAIPHPAPGPQGQLPFTPIAIRVLNHSLSEARKLDQERVGTEHLLLGLLDEESCPGTRILEGFGLKRDGLRSHILDLLSNVKPLHHLGETTRKVIDLACEEAGKLSQDSIDSGHLMLGLVRGEGGITAEVLRALKMDPGNAESEIRKALKARPPAEKGRLLWRRPRDAAGGAATDGGAIFSFTRRAEQVLWASLEQAEVQGSHRIGSEHLLLALSRVPDVLPAGRDTSGGGADDFQRRVEDLVGTKEREDMAPDAPSNGMMQVTGFALTDAQGKVRATLSVAPDGSPELALFDQHGHRKGFLRLCLEGGLEATPRDIPRQAETPAVPAPALPRSPAPAPLAAHAPPRDGAPARALDAAPGRRPASEEAPAGDAEEEEPSRPARRRRQGRKTRLNCTREELKRMYVDQGMTAKQIAEKYGVAAVTVAQRAMKLGISKRARRSERARR